MKSAAAWSPACVVLLLSGATSLSAQSSIRGTVVAEGTGLAVSGASVEARGRGDERVGSVVTGPDGSFDIAVDPGRYVLILTRDAYSSSREGPYSVGAGETLELSLSLLSTTYELSPVVVAVSRAEERALSSPAAISIVRAREIEKRIAVTPMEHVRTVAGVDVARTGLMQSSVVGRGFNDVYPTAMLVLADHRYASVPSNRLNANYMIPITDLDIDRIEVALGPGSALYGPNAASGVTHIFTKSPIDHPGTSVTLAGGQRSVARGQFRTAFAPSEQVGFKVSGQYFKGESWPWTDPVEEAARGLDPSNPKIGARSFDAERWGGDARLDLRPGDDTELVASAGVNMTVDNVELSGVGRSHEVDYRYTYFQTRFTSGRLFAQVFGNYSDAGDSHFFRTGDDVVDKSRMWVGQIQHGADLIGGRTSATYGVDLQRTDTRTGGTITGRFEADDVVDEVGGYLHTVTSLSPRLDLVAAVRVDWHNRLVDPVVSPRAALVFRPAEGHALRATFNRAFVTPPPLSLFLDLLVAPIPIAPGIAYDLRAVGVPESGYSFDECPGGHLELCMRLPGAGPTPAPADATLAWDALIQAFAPSLAPFLPAPTGQVETVLRSFDLGLAEEGAYPFVPTASRPMDLEPLRPTITNSYEVGYKGLLGERFLLSTSVFYSRLEDFIAPSLVETPNVFLDPATTSAYVNTQLAPLVSGGAMTQAEVDALVQGLTLVPVGTVTPAEWDSADILAFARNYGDVDLWGFEVGGILKASDEVTFDGSISVLSTECFDFDGDGACGGDADKALNTPRVKGALTTRYTRTDGRFFGEARVRASDGFPMAFGVFEGDIPGFVTVDLSMGLPITQLPGVGLRISATNVFDNVHRELIGGAPFGRLLLAELRYDF